MSRKYLVLFLSLSVLFLVVQAAAKDLIPAGTILHCTMDEPNFSPKTATVGDLIHALCRAFQEATRRLDSQFFHIARGRLARFVGEDALEIARTHCHALRQCRHGKIGRKMLRHPNAQFAQWIALH